MQSGLPLSSATSGGLRLGYSQQAAAGCFRGLCNSITPCARRHRGSVLIAAAAAVPSKGKGKRAKFPKTHPSKQSLKQQAKQNQVQKEEQHQKDQKLPPKAVQNKDRAMQQQSTQSQGGQQQQGQRQQQQSQEKKQQQKQQKQQKPQQQQQPQGQKKESHTVAKQQSGAQTGPAPQQQQQQQQQQQDQQQQQSAAPGQQQMQPRTLFGAPQLQRPKLPTQEQLQRPKQQASQQAKPKKKKANKPQQPPQEPAFKLAAPPPPLQQSQKQELLAVDSSRVAESATAAAAAVAAAAAAAAAADAAAFKLAAPPPRLQQLQKQEVLAVDSSKVAEYAAAAAALAAAAAAAEAAAAADAAASEHQLDLDQTQHPAAGHIAQPGATASLNGSSSSSSTVERPAKVAGISYQLEEAQIAQYRAAGVVLYDFDGPEGQPRVLLVWETKKGAWNVPAGKIDRRADGLKHPDATAARELEEETHGLIPAAHTRSLLDGRCPVMYCKDGKMAIYLLRLAGGQQLPELLERRLEAGLSHPNAEGIDKLGWFTAGQLQRGQFYVKRGKGGNSSSSQQPPAADAEDEGEDDSSDAPAGLAGAVVAPSLAELQLVDSILTQQQEGQQQGEARLPLRMPVYRNRGRIASWLDILSRGQAPAVGLQVLQDHPQQQQQDQQQQQQEGEEEEEQQEEDQEQLDLALPALQELPLPAKWSAFAASAAGVEPVASHSAVADAAGGQAFLATAGVGGAAAGSGVARHDGASSSSSSSAPAPWAIGVWSGQLARRQEQQKQESS